MTESDKAKELPAVPESRVSRIKRIISALSDFEQDEIAYAIQAEKMREYNVRLSERKNLIAYGMHTGFWAGAFWGAFMGLFSGMAVLFHGGILHALVAFFGTLILGGGFFGLFMGLFMVLQLKITTASMAKNLKVGQSALFQVQKVEVPVSMAESIELSLTALASKKGWRIESINREEGTVRAMTPPSVRSPGEVVGIKADPLTDNSSTISIYSKAIFTALDFGKNKQNVTLLAKEIEEAGHVHSILKLQ